MNRRVVRDGGLEAVKEVNGKATRQFGSGAVLNVLQWVRRGEARFTVEGEGIEVWVCEEQTLNDATAP